MGNRPCGTYSFLHVQEDPTTISEYSILLCDMFIAMVYNSKLGNFQIEFGLEQLG